jgi:transglutaminase-like putative cysteine protease
MRGFKLSLVALLVFSPLAPRLSRLACADGPQGKLIEDIWEAAFLEGARAGHVHTEVREVEKNGKTYLHTVLSLNLTVKRNTDVIQLRMDTGDTETADGKVLGTFMRQYLSPDKQQLITGVVKGRQLHLTLDRSKALEPAPWDPATVGLYRQQRQLADRKVKPGDRFTYKSFEPTINLVIRNNVQIKDYETVELLGKTPKKLLRVETKPEKLDKVQLPTLVSWVDENYVPLRSQVEVPVGKITLYRTTRAQATGKPTLARLTDIGIRQMVSLKQRIRSPYDTKAAVYRITISGDDDPASAFSRDQRQQVKNVTGNTFEMHVRASQAVASSAPGEDNDEKSPGLEFIKTSYFINCADARVKQLARQAVGSQTDAWKKALRIERWVHSNMRVVNDEAMATADHVARTLRGDCTEFAMLTAAMCRAEGIPSRTAIGLIYADVNSRPVFAFHMWTEVWIKGQWIPIDATLGRGYVGATHLKITDHSWHDTLTLTPVFPLVRVLRRVAIEVVSVE